MQRCEQHRLSGTPLRVPLHTVCSQLLIHTVCSQLLSMDSYDALLFADLDVDLMPLEV